MNEAEFVKHMLTLAKESFPTLYAKHIRGRRLAFTQEHQPVSGKETVEVLGHVPQRMRILWALAELLYQYSPRRLPDPRKVTDVAQTFDAYNIAVLRAVVQLGFWEAVTESLKLGKPHGLLCIGDGWSVNRVPRPTKRDHSQMETRYYLLSVMAEGAIASRELGSRQK